MSSNEFNLSNDMYLSKLCRYKEIYEKSVKPIEEQLYEVNREITDYNLKIERGHKETPLHSEPSGSMTFYPEEFALHDRRSICIDILDNINKNIIITLYHFWERYWFDIIRGKEKSEFKYDDFKDYYKIMRRISFYYKISNEIKKIKDIANALKHGNRRKTMELSKCYPYLFERHDEFFISCFGADAISIKRADVDEAFTIVSNSGPGEPVKS